MDFDNSNASEEKRPPGRPKIDPALARSKVVAVRITEKGYGKVKALADAKDMSVAEYTRMVLKMLAEGSLLIR